MPISSITLTNKTDGARCKWRWVDNELVCGGVYAHKCDRRRLRGHRGRVRMSGRLSQQRASKEDAYKECRCALAKWLLHLEFTILVDNPQEKWLQKI